MAKKLAMVFGVVFLLVGVLGFFPNPIIGTSMDAWFHADTVHNLIHIVTGLVFVYIAVKTGASATAMKVFGVVYLLVALLGFVDMDLFGLTHVNMADNWLHVVLGVVILLAGFTAKDSAPMTMGGNNMGQM